MTREEAAVFMRKVQREAMKGSYAEEAYEMAIKALEEPPKTGKWIFVHPLQKDDSGAYMCSCCKNGDWDIKLTDKFCKFCGAKMLKEGGGDNETN